MPRIALGIEYDGSAFSGWQSQAHAASVQAAVETALSSVADHPVEVVAAGRTDAGVHAAMQVAHFDSIAIRTTRSWVLGANSGLPQQITVLWAREVPEGFHARYAAMARSYRYCILNRPVRPALGSQYVSWVRQPLDHGAMHEAAQLLLGEHDFSSFRAAECQSRTPMRRLYRIEVQRQGEVVMMSVTANAFLHHMVRNIAGVLIAVGCGDQSAQWVAQVLAARDRTRGGVTAPPNGLYLTGVRYAAALGLPSEAGDAPVGVCPGLPLGLPGAAGPSIDAPH